MTIRTIRFNKTILTGLVGSGKPAVIKDAVEKGLKFKVGRCRAVFQFEKRIRGRKGASPVTITIGAFPTVGIDEARQEARRLANLCEKGIDPRKVSPSTETRAVTLGQAIAQFFEMKQGLNKRTLANYHAILRKLPVSWLEMDLSDISSNMIVEQFYALHKETVKQCWEFLILMGSIWNTCAPLFRDSNKQSILKVCPVHEARTMLKGIKKRNPRRSVISINQLGLFMEKVEEMASSENSTWQAMARIGLLCLFTGFRYAEARCLRWDYVDLDQGIIRLPGVVKDGGGSFTGTKNKRDHLVPLASYPLEMLRAMHDDRVTVSPYVFPGTTGKKAMAKAQKPVEHISQLLGSHYSIHASRRTFASVANEVGLGYLNVKRLLNHAFEGGVTGGYVVPDFNPESRRKHFQAICDFILERRAEHLGEARSKDGSNKTDAMFRLRLFAIELGLDPGSVLNHQHLEGAA